MYIYNDTTQENSIHSCLKLQFYADMCIFRTMAGTAWGVDEVDEKLKLKLTSSSESFFWKLWGNNLQRSSLFIEDNRRLIDFSDEIHRVNRLFGRFHRVKSDISISKTLEINFIPWSFIWVFGRTNWIRTFSNIFFFFFFLIFNMSVIRSRYSLV